MRTESGGFTLDDAVPLDRIRSAAAADALSDLLLAPDAGLDAFPVVDAFRRRDRRDREGPVRPPGGAAAGHPDDARYRLRDPDGQLVAVAALRDGRLAPEKVLTGGDDRPKPRPERAPAEPAPPRRTCRRRSMRVVPGSPG